MAKLTTVDPALISTPDTTTEEPAIGTGSLDTLGTIDDIEPNEPDTPAPLLPTPAERFKPVGIPDEVLSWAGKKGLDTSEADPTFWQTVGAMWRRENTLGALTSSESIAESFRTDTSAALDPQAIADRLDKDGLLTVADRFRFVQTENDYAALKADIDRENADRRIQEASGFWRGLGAGLVAGVPDPINLLPIGAGIRGAKTVTGAALRVGASASASASVSETALQSIEQTRTTEETANGIGGSFILGSLLGTAAYKIVGSKTARHIEGEIERDFATATSREAAESVTGLAPKTADAGARAVSVYQELRDRGLLDSGRVTDSAAANALATMTKELGSSVSWIPIFGKRLGEGLRNPVLDLIDSSSPAAREFVEGFVNVPWVLKTHVGPQETAFKSNVQGRVKQFRGELAQWIREAEDVWKANRKKYGDGSRFGSSASRQDFAERVYYAAVSGGRSADGDKSVEAVAASVHKRIFEPLLQVLVKNGVLPEDVLVSEAGKRAKGQWYVPRAWKRDVVSNKRDRFEEIITEWARGKLTKEVEDAKTSPDKLVMRELKKRLGISRYKRSPNADDIDLKARAVALDLWSRMSGVDVEIGDYLPLKAGSYLKGRVLDDIPDELLAREGFIETDIFRLAQRYTRTAGTDAAISEQHFNVVTKKGEDGALVDEIEPDLDLKGVREKIVAQYAELLDRAKTEDPKLAAKLETERTRVLSSVEALRDMARGRFDAQYGANLRAAVNNALAFNYMRLLGGVVVSSLSDPVNIALANGYGRSLRLGVVPLLRDFKRMYWAADSDVRRANRLAGAVMEIELNSRMSQITDLTDPLGDGQGVTSRSLNRMAELFTSLSGIRFWTDLWKTVAANTTQARIVENVTKIGYDKLGKAEQAWMNTLGIGRSEADRIAKAWNAQTTDKYAGGIPFADHTTWADEDIATVFRSAMANESSNVVVTPELGDRPVFFSTPVGRIAGQFKSYMFASQGRLFARNLQLANLDNEKRLSVYTGMFGLLLASAVSVGMRQTMRDAGTDKDEGLIERWEKNPGAATYDVLKQHGAFSLMFEGSEMIGRVGSGSPLLLLAERVAGDETLDSRKRMALRDRAADIASIPFGPTGGAAVDAATSLVRLSQTVSSNLFGDGEDQPTRLDVRRARKLLPFQNVPGLQQLLNYGERELGTVFEWPEVR